MNAEDTTSMSHGAYRWEACTRNHWTLHVADIHVASVVRNRSWRKYTPVKPWYVEIFGSRWVRGLDGDKNWFRTLDQARIAAERELKVTIQVVASGL